MISAAASGAAAWGLGFGFPLSRASRNCSADGFWTKPRRMALRSERHSLTSCPSTLQNEHEVEALPCGFEDEGLPLSWRFAVGSFGGKLLSWRACSTVRSLDCSWRTSSSSLAAAGDGGDAFVLMTLTEVSTAIGDDEAVAGAALTATETEWVALVGEDDGKNVVMLMRYCRYCSYDIVAFGGCTENALLTAWNKDELFVLSGTCRIEQCW